MAFCINPILFTLMYKITLMTYFLFIHWLSFFILYTRFAIYILWVISFLYIILIMIGNKSNELEVKKKLIESTVDR